MIKVQTEKSSHDRTKFHPLQVIGWREYAKFPDLHIDRIKAKIDTGARSSCLHAINIEFFSRHGERWVRFDVHPEQRSAQTVVHCQAPLLELRHVRDSGGRATLRPVIETRIVLGETSVDAELTLVSRDTMGFRMLIGRQAIRGKFLVDPGHSYKMGRRKKKKVKKKKVKKKQRA